MELKTIVAIGLVVFIVGALIFLKIRGKNKKRPRAAENAAEASGNAGFLHTRKNKRRFILWFISLIQT